MWSGFVELVKPVNLTDQGGSVSTSARSSVLHIGLWLGWIGLELIWSPCEVTGWRYILVLVEYFSRFIWTRAYETASQEAFMIFGSTNLVPFLRFHLCIFRDNGSHFTRAELTTFPEYHGIIQVRAPIIHPFFSGFG